MGNRIMKGIKCLITDKKRLLSINTVKKTLPMTMASSVVDETSNNGQRPITAKGKLSVFKQVASIV